MIIVTGGAGFIGFNVAIEINRLGDEVAIVDYKYSNKKFNNIFELKKFRFVEPKQNIKKWSK